MEGKQDRSGPGLGTQAGLRASGMPTWQMPALAGVTQDPRHLSASAGRGVCLLCGSGSFFGRPRG